MVSEVSVLVYEARVLVCVVMVMLFDIFFGDSTSSTQTTTYLYFFDCPNPLIMTELIYSFISIYDSALNVGDYFFLYFRFSGARAHSQSLDMIFLVILFEESFLAFTWIYYLSYQ